MSVLVHAEVDGDRLESRRRAARVAADPRRRRRDDASRHQRRHRATAAASRPAPAPASTIPPRSPWPSRRCCAGSRPIKNMCRTVTHDTEFMGQPMIAGQKCMLLFESANRDETRFDDPFRFDVQRNPNEHLAFGFGAHFCLGQALARLELQGDVRAAAAAPPRPRARGRSRRPAPPAAPTSSAASRRCPCASRPSAAARTGAR